MHQQAKPIYFVILLAGATLMACSTPAPINLYLLNPIKAVDVLKPSKRASSIVALTSITLPAYLARRQIVTRSSSNQLKLAEFDRWGGNLRKNITQTLIKNISTRVQQSQLNIIPLQSDLSADMNIELEISRFERFPDDKVYLSSMWRIIDRSGQPVAIHNADFSIKVIDKSYDATVTSMSLLLADLSQQIANALLHQK
ncbi:MAG: PqiC family protein [Mariprofundus sp.]|nr:PqiC family protein [Mariprofundus sp.]